MIVGKCENTYNSFLFPLFLLFLYISSPPSPACRPHAGVACPGELTHVWHRDSAVSAHMGRRVLQRARHIHPSLRG